MFFPGGSIMLFKQTQIIQECLSNRDFFSRRFYLFVKQTLLSYQTDINFPRNSYLVLKHIQIFQEPLFSHQTDIHFPGRTSSQIHTIFQENLSSPRTNTHFPGRYPRQTISLIGLGDCFRNFILLGAPQHPGSSTHKIEILSALFKLFFS